MKKKTYTLKPTKKQLKEMKRYWKLLQNEIDTHWTKIRELEESMEEQTGIDGIEFFYTESGPAGIGNISRTMKLYQEEDLKNV